LSFATHNRFAVRACSLSFSAVFLTLSLCPSSLSSHPARPQETQDAQQKADITHAAPRGKKLILSDGSFHLVRSYERRGDRVRYYSIERSAWEEIPASLVDWGATQKEEASAAALEAKIEEKKKEFRMERIAEEVDADASLEVAPRIFLPDGAGLFVLEGKTIRSLQMVGADVKRDKGRVLTQIFVPVPIPTRHKVELPGERASFRVTTAQPEFFIRTPDGHEPEMELIQARVKGGVREIERISTIITGQKSEDRKNVMIARWMLAKGVFRLTLSQSLEPGEYVLAEIRPEEGMDLGVWDFGVDPPAPKAGAPPVSPRKPPAKK
jgi:catechol 2,3-dioxygenase-like lactoylglutathione lyase family enzyme